jgi:hypothetical protein
LAKINFTKSIRPKSIVGSVVEKEEISPKKEDFFG